MEEKIPTIEKARYPSTEEKSYIKKIKIKRAFIYYFLMSFVVVMTVSLFVLLFTKNAGDLVSPIFISVTCILFSARACLSLRSTVNYKYNKRMMVRVSGTFEEYDGFKAHATIDGLLVILPDSWRGKILEGEKTVEGYLDDTDVLYVVSMDNPPWSVPEDL